MEFKIEEFDVSLLQGCSSIYIGYNDISSVGNRAILGLNLIQSTETKVYDLNFTGRGYPVIDGESAYAANVTITNKIAIICINSLLDEAISSLLANKMVEMIDQISENVPVHFFTSLHLPAGFEESVIYYHNFHTGGSSKKKNQDDLVKNDDPTTIFKKMNKENAQEEILAFKSINTDDLHIKDPFCGAFIHYACLKDLKLNFYCVSGHKFDTAAVERGLEDDGSLATVHIVGKLLCQLTGLSYSEKVTDELKFYQRITNCNNDILDLYL